MCRGVWSTVQCEAHRAWVTAASSLLCHPFLRLSPLTRHISPLTRYIGDFSTLQHVCHHVWHSSSSLSVFATDWNQGHQGSKIWSPEVPLRDKLPLPVTSPSLHPPVAPLLSSPKLFRLNPWSGHGGKSPAAFKMGLKWNHGTKANSDERKHSEKKCEHQLYQTLG